MDFSLAPAEEALRSEVREFLRRELPESHPEPQIVPETGTDEEFEFALDFSKKLSKRGWLTATWPKEYGGQDFGPIETRILSDELAYHGASTVNAIGQLIASLLFKFGTEEQKKRFLPDIAECSVIWGEGYSEPDSGSDLASLRTIARRDGDEYVIDGTKIWTGAGHRSHWMFVYSRTNTEAPKHHSINYLLVDMKNPGVTVVPLPNMAGVVTFAQEFFENVRTPAENLIGEEGAGWQQRAATRGGGLTATDSPAKVLRHLEQLIHHCQQQSLAGRRFDDPLVRQKLARSATEVEVAQLLSWRNAWLASRESITPTEAESSGILNREVNQRLARSAVEILGLYGALLPQNERWAPLNGWFAHSYMFTVASTIYGGTVEIHRNVLANRGLGLPRG